MADLSDERIDAAVDLLHRMLETPGTHIRPSWKDAIRPVLLGLLTLAEGSAAPEPERRDCSRWDGEHCWAEIEGEKCKCEAAAVDDLMSEWAENVQVGRKRLSGSAAPEDNLRSVIAASGLSATARSDDPPKGFGPGKWTQPAAVGEPQESALRLALQEILNVMGPKPAPCCGGCEWEWNEALKIARRALTAEQSPSQEKT